MGRVTAGAVGKVVGMSGTVESLPYSANYIFFMPLYRSEIRKCPQAMDGANTTGIPK
jgi:hypothetical protein